MSFTTAMIEKLSGHLELNLNFFEAIVQCSDDAIISKTLAGIVTSWNRGAEAIFGYTADEMVGQPMTVIFPAGRENEEKVILERIKQGEKVDHFETVRQRKDGTLVDVSVTISPIRDNDGTIVGASKIARDISGQKLLEQQLIASVDQFEDLYNHAPCGYHSLDRNGVFIKINDTELEWLGCERHEVIGKMKMTHFLSSESKALFMKMYPQFMASGNIENLEFDLISRSGKLRQVSAGATAIKDAEGNYLMSRSVLYDVTELKTAQQELQKLNVEQHVMLDNELIGIVKLRNRRAIWVNKAMERLFGYEEGELEGQSSRILYTDESSYEAIGAAAYPILNANGTYRTQIELRKKCGEKFWVDVSGTKISDTNNESMWIMLDISAQKKHEQDIEHIAYHDILTGLPNRLLVSDRLKQALANAGRTNQSLAVCYLDLDGFKPVNDIYGHSAGDKLLIEIAKRMLETVRGNDTVGRLGGDEFVLLLVGLESDAECQFVLQRVIAAINSPICIDGTIEVILGASIGVTLFPSDSSEPDTLLRHADYAMYHAKKSGRNQICFCAEANNN
jgi:diguanylate cyclase (GGDEF)-like protein/PAS domain S-box-containing protein